MLRYKLVSVLALTAIVLSACGGYEEGEKLTLTDSIIGYDTIHDFEEQLKDTDGEIDVDGETINMLFEDYDVKVIEVSKKDKMVLVQMLDGSDEGTEWWVPEADLQNNTKK
ncbi:hypothetical protein QFZ31_002302 [Neobacillus niacini]|uniref:hypothetical protein n=1 Tax=Neobacillus driksii TaxID=3035913 RepID=UPI002789406C|nr:hypothetical protein [Neobacillus niacini]MDQ0972424.1 hypothetical protein [Neobacillus niacini]